MHPATRAISLQKPQQQSTLDARRVHAGAGACTANRGIGSCSSNSTMAGAETTQKQQAAYMLALKLFNSVINFVEPQDRARWLAQRSARARARARAPCAAAAAAAAATAPAQAQG